MIYSPRHGLLFLKTRKTAGTSIEIELSRHMDDDAVLTPVHADEELRVELAGRGAQNFREPMPFREMTAADCRATLRHRRRPVVDRFWNHMTAAEARYRLPRWDDLMKVAVVRDPWDVAASHFHMEAGRRDDVRTFDDFVERVGLKPNWSIYAIGARVAVDEVVRYEHLTEDLPAVFGKVGITVGALPWAKAGTGRPHYREVLEQRHVEMVAEACRLEIETFGYPVP